ncbi:CPBP family intramembrane glutamic endopeptidase [Salipaludibacillus sp. HK11]|uniref:CPBP family intramembrane glutamic endopeptidase n=1 Tax=Salipaludibacillus sp. HK11 TaxID=3394320 RepID=UPI0039FC7AA8
MEDYEREIRSSALHQFMKVLKDEIQRLLPGKSSWIIGILITSLVFGVLHLHSSFNLGIYCTY